MEDAIILYYLLADSDESETKIPSLQPNPKLRKLRERSKKMWLVGVGLEKGGKKKIVRFVSSVRAGEMASTDVSKEVRFLFEFFLPFLFSILFPSFFIQLLTSVSNPLR